MINEGKNKLPNLYYTSNKMIEKNLRRITYLSMNWISVTYF